MYEKQAKKQNTDDRDNILSHHFIRKSIF